MLALPLFESSRVFLWAIVDIRRVRYTHLHFKIFLRIKFTGLFYIRSQYVINNQNLGI